jgi:hypothetical protein
VIGTGARPVRTQRTGGGGGQTEANGDTFGSHTRSKDRIPLEHARSSMVSGVQQLESTHQGANPQEGSTINPFQHQKMEQSLLRSKATTHKWKKQDML